MLVLFLLAPRMIRRRSECAFLGECQVRPDFIVASTSMDLGTPLVSFLDCAANY
eukprot:SAG31_NODE_18293_length_641_cov_1.003690_1_plen_53_part_01